MRQALLVVDVQASFEPPNWLVKEITEIAQWMPSVASIERHDEAITPFESQLGWKPGVSDDGLVAVDKTFIKNGYLPPPDMITYLQGLNLDRVLVCGIQADTCVLAAGFALFDVGLRPTLLSWLTTGSSLDRSGKLGGELWRHHFREIIEKRDGLSLVPKQ